MPKRKLTPEEEAALVALRSRLLLTLSFIESVQDFPMGPQFRAVVEEAAEDRDLRGLKLIKRDIDEMKMALLPEERARLEVLLREKLGVDQTLERLEERDAIAKLLKRGIIKSEKERKRLQIYLECLEATGGDPAEIADLNRLLTTQ